MPQVSVLARPGAFNVVPPPFQLLYSETRGIQAAIRRNGFTMMASSVRRQIHSSKNRHSAPTFVSTHTLTSTTDSAISTQPATIDVPKPSPLSILPFTNIVRSLFVTSVSSSPFILPPSLWMMAKLAHTTNPLLNPDRNPVLRYFMKKTFYAQFCAGENPSEVRRTISSLKDIGFTGVILCYAREVVLSQAQLKNLASCGEGAEAEACVRNEIIPWAEGTLNTVRLTSPGDFVSVKFTGAGRQALYTLSQRLPPSKALGEKIDEICNLAAERGIRLLFDAEQAAVQAGIDDWTLAYQKKFNTVPGKAVIYGTYQAYLKAAPAVVANHLGVAAREGFTLGVKLVRGAYLGSDPREIIHDTKEQTDACYDGIAAAVLKRQWNGVLKPSNGDLASAFPPTSLCVASHSLDSVRKARAICDSGEAKTEVSYGQLQGMADEVSCELVADTKGGAATLGGTAVGLNRPQAYKYLVWGSTGECMKYLLRRAHENKDAVGRTRAGRDAMWEELKRRISFAFKKG